jgi:hypothetical protein
MKEITMKTDKLTLCVLGSMLLFTVAAASAADAPKLTFKFKTINLRGALQTQPNGINDQGVIVGQYLDSSGFSHGYIWEKGKKPVTLDDPNGTSTGAYAINSNYNDKSGEMVVGIYTNSSGTQEGFLYQKRTFTDVPGPNGILPSAANGINDAGDIVGGYDHSGFLLEGTNYTYPLSVPGAIETYAQDTNNNGVIILVWVDSDNTFHGAYTRDNGKTYKKLKDVPGSSGLYGSFPTCIDNGQDISFTWYDSNKVEHGALCTKCLTNPHYQKFNYPKAYQTNAACVNDKKTIVGYYLKEKTSNHWSGFEATYK